MIGLGTLVNTATVLVGGGLGLIAKKGVSERLQTALTKAIGIAVVIIGIAGVLGEMFVLKDGKLSIEGTIMLILSLVTGTLIGELIDIEKRLEWVGNKIKNLAGKNKNGDDRFVEGFVTNTLVICVGAMAIVGSMNDGLYGDPSTLYAKSILDGVIALVFASTMGVGVLFAAIPLFLYQGGITLLSGVLSEYMSDPLISNISCVGSALILAIGLNMVADTKIRTGNMLPALIFPVLWAVFQ